MAAFGSADRAYRDTVSRRTPVSRSTRRTVQPRARKRDNLLSLRHPQVVRQGILRWSKPTSMPDKPCPKWPLLRCSLLAGSGCSVTAVRELEARADQGPFRVARELLTTMPGVSDVTVRVILAEIGDDMSCFPTSGHLVSWAGLCPRLEESAGKQRSTRVRRGVPWLKTVLVQAARAAANKHDSHHRAQYLRLKARRGPNKAALAVAASILTAACHMLKYGVEYRDLGPFHFERDKQVQVARLLHRLKGLGVDVTVNPAA